jgi:hypothetical protein
MRRLLAVLGLMFVTGAEAADRCPVWTIANATYRYWPESRELAVTHGNVTFRPLAGLGPEFLWQGKPQPLAEVKVDLVRAETDRAGLICHYRAMHGNLESPYTISLSPTQEGLRIRIQSASTGCSRVRPGRTEGLGKWFRINYTRNAEPYGQSCWPRVTYVPGQNLYVSVSWDMAASRGTSWEATDERFSGEGNFASGLDVVYRPRTDGTRLPVDEALTLRVGSDLWSTVPLPKQKPSEHRQELAQEVFLDVWGGTARETEYFLRHLAAITQGNTRFLTVLQNWQAGGFDALLPDSVLLPDYPPNPGIGSIDELRQLSEFARSVGRFALRTNYMVLRDGAPSVKAGRAHAALDADGKRKWHTRPSDWLPLANRQEEEIRRLFSPNAGFTDQLTSGGAPWSYLDFDAQQAGSGAMGDCLRKQRQLARCIKDTCRGPLGSETNIDEQLLGEFVDTGDFGIFDGYHRAFTPEFKLRRLHHLSTFHGMGLMYRYFEMPPFPRFHRGEHSYRSNPAECDDYRAAEVLFGNGGYLFYEPGMSWEYVLTECLLVGTLQKHYALQPVRDVFYWKDGGWQTLSQLVAAGIDPMSVPWAPQPDCLKRILTHYASGLRVVVNRLAEEFPVSVEGQTVVLPRSGWVAWMPEGKLLAYSAHAPGTRKRVDFLLDRTADLRYLAPRGGQWLGQTQPTLWRAGKIVLRVDPSTGDAWINGQQRKYRPPRLPPLSRIDFRFDRGTLGWSGQRDLGPLRIENGALKAEIVGGDPALGAPPIDLPPDSVKTVVIRLRVTCGRFGQFYWSAANTQAAAEQMCLHFEVRPGPAFQEIRIPVGSHPLWKGHRIISLRFDPEHGESPGSVEIESIRGE